jgi:hypothetical protein
MTYSPKLTGNSFIPFFENKISQDSKQESNLLASFAEARRPLMHPRSWTSAEGDCAFFVMRSFALPQFGINRGDAATG